MTVGQALTFLATPLYYKLVFDRVINHRDGAILPVLVMGMVGLLLVMLAVDLVLGSLRAAVGMRSVNELRLTMLEHVGRLPVDYFSHVSAGDVLARFSSDLTAVERVITTSLYKLVLNGLVTIICVAALFVVEWRLALFTLAVLPVVAIVPKVLGARAAAASYARRQDDGRVAEAIHETLAAHLTIRAFSLAGDRLERLRRLLHQVYATGRRLNLLNAYVETSTNIGLLLAQVLITGGGAYLAVNGYLSGGSLIAFVGLLLNASGAASALTTFVPDLTLASGSLRRVNELLAAAVPTRSEQGVTESSWRFQREIRFSNVGLVYGEHRAVDDVSFTIQAGESVALVGRSGSGKSTILNLLMRLHQPSTGKIAVDGLDAGSISPDVLRAQIGAVFQANHLFHDTVRQNIRLGRLDASDTEVEQAARAANVHEAILRLPEGYDTVIGEENPLSGGERQRLALARALLREPAILILDEVTAALDPATEAAVFTTLTALAGRQTCIHVTHRLAIAPSMDRILVFEEGRLIEAGTHTDLLTQRGAYYAMWEKQAHLIVDPTGTQAQLDRLFLRTIPIFAELGEEFLSSLARQFRSEIHGAGTTVIVEGHAGDTFYVIVRGRVQVTRAVVAGQAPPTQSWILETGDHFGEMALLANLPRNATVTTIDPCLFLVLSKEHFHSALETAPHLRARLETIARERSAAHA